MAPVTAAVAAAVAAGACADQPLPGTMLGTYQVVGQSLTNTCGLGMPNPWNFDVQLSRDGGTLYWSWIDGRPALYGPLTNQSDAELTATQQANVDGTADGGLGPCTLSRADSVQVQLGTGSQPAAFTATIQYAFSVVSGSDCSDQLTSVGGQYDALPCTIVYSAEGSRR